MWANLLWITEEQLLAITVTKQCQTDPLCPRKLCVMGTRRVNTVEGIRTRKPTEWVGDKFTSQCWLITPRLMPVNTNIPYSLQFYDRLRRQLITSIELDNSYKSLD